MEALKNATSEILLISPWMNLDTVTDDLCQLIWSALKRKVMIRIGFGLGINKPGAEGERNRASARAVIAKVMGLLRASELQYIEFLNLANTHEKLLVCDRAFAVSTSFNWLSFRGDEGDIGRRETGLLVRGPSNVEQIAERINDALKSGRPFSQSGTPAQQLRVASSGR
jgi:phosphatidylserine/phosphatidylglycerophosphate/cardiolipin synthase-like enzyme